MDGLLLPILIAAAVMLVVYSVAQIVASLTDGEKRKLKQRLTSQGLGGPGLTASQRAITLHQEADATTAMLTRVGFFRWINRLLIYAYPETKLTTFLSIALSIGLGVGLITYLVTSALLIGAIAAGIGFYAPCMWLANRRNRRQRLLADQLPEALDFLSRILKAGHSFSTGLQMMAEELPKPLADEFRRGYDEHSLGQPLDACLRGIAKRIESTDFAFFVTAVLIQRQTGGDLSEVLGNISGMIRQRIRLQQHVKAKTAEGRFTGYILSAFPAVMFVIAYMLNPDYAGVLIKTSQGLMLLGTAFGLQLLGLFFIKRITTVTV